MDYKDASCIHKKNWENLLKEIIEINKYVPLNHIVCLHISLRVSSSQLSKQTHNTPYPVRCLSILSYFISRLWDIKKGVVKKEYQVINSTL